MTRRCRYCHRDFTPGRNAFRRTYCYAPACVDAHRAYRRDFVRDRRDALRHGGTVGKEGARSDIAPRPRPGSRTCLGCGRPFDSRGAHHRICPTCKRRSRRRDRMDEPTLD